MERIGILETKLPGKIISHPGQVLRAAMLFAAFMCCICGEISAQVKSGMSNSEILDQINIIVSTTNWTNEAEAAAASRKIEELTGLLGKDNNNDSTTTRQNHLQDSLNPSDGMSGLFRMALDAYDAEADEAENLSVDLGAPVREEIIRDYEKEQKETRPMTPGDLPKLVVIDFSEKSSLQELAALPAATHVTEVVLIYGTYADSYTLESLMKIVSALRLKMLIVSGFEKHPVIPSQPGTLQLNAIPDLEVLYWINNGQTELPVLAALFPHLEELYLEHYPQENLIPAIKGLKTLLTLGYAGTPLSSQKISELKTLFPNSNLIIQ